MINNNSELKDSLLPPPEILVKYKEIGIGDDIIKLVKKEQEHRHSLQRKYQVNYRMGQLFGFILCAMIIAGVFYLMDIGYPTESYILLGGFSVLIILISIITKSKPKPRKKMMTKRLPQKRRNYR